MDCSRSGKRQALSQAFAASGLLQSGLILQLLNGIIGCRRNASNEITMPTGCNIKF